MEHKKHTHLLANLWESYPEGISNNFRSERSNNVIKHLADILSIGPYYHYVINIADYSLSQVSENTQNIHGLTCQPTTIKEIIDQIHPDDLDYVLKAEEATIVKMQEIGFDHQLFLKTSYYFRMQVADGSYHLFHHQAIHLSKDDNGQLATALNIHTDIQHLTTVNNKIVLVTGIGPRNDYFQIDLGQQEKETYLSKLSNREMEVLGLVSRGLSSQQIADKLFISPETVRVHRRNLLKKTNSHNKSTLLRQCMEWGLI